MKKMKLNRGVTFRTNEDLYFEFGLKCKQNKQKIGDRLNALIIADLNNSTPFENKENQTHEETSAGSEI
jgi:hypothetical protein